MKYKLFSEKEGEVSHDLHVISWNVFNLIDIKLKYYAKISVFEGAVHSFVFLCQSGMSRLRKDNLQAFC